MTLVFGRTGVNFPNQSESDCLGRPPSTKECLECAIPSRDFISTALADFVQHLPGQFPIHDSSSDLTITSVTDHIKQKAFLRCLDQLKICTSLCAQPESTF